jgi:excinuclease ABC subunit A
MKSIRIRGARTHNLQNLNMELPRDRLIVITGLSGSGKSSLAFDTIYAEGQRRYVESLSAYARQFLSMMEKPDVDSIEGLSPAISIEQKSTSHNPRSTVGTVTEIHDYLRLLFARVGTPRCPDHGVALHAQTVSEMVDQVLTLPGESAWMLLAPVVQQRKGEHQQLFEQLRSQGFIRALVDGELLELDETPALKAKSRHDIAVVVDRFRIRPGLEQRLAESFETALRLSGGLARVASYRRHNDAEKAPGQIFSARYACTVCGYSLDELEPRLFSFNNPAGACPACDGLGLQATFDPALVVTHPELSLAGGAVRGWDRHNQYYFDMVTSLARHYGFDVEAPFQTLPERVRSVILYGSGGEPIEFVSQTARGRQRRRPRPFEGVLPNMHRRYQETESAAVREQLAKYLSNQPCPECAGQRLNRQARHVFVDGANLPELCDLPIEQAYERLAHLELPGQRGEIGRRILQEITARLGFLSNVGLNYLNLARSAETLSGGEAQRIRLASQIGAGLVGVLYVLDEPSIGLHQRDNQRLLDTLHSLRDMGNTVMVVEHDEQTIRQADHVVDMGPGAGVHGGVLVAQGTPEAIAANTGSLTGQYLAGSRQIALPVRRVRRDPQRVLTVRGARAHNLRDISVEFPLGLFICVTGVSGSGKSTLVNETLYPLAARELNRAQARPVDCGGIESLRQLDKVINIDQSPIGRTPRSNPATYTGLFTPIRELFAGTPEARARGYKPGRFSFNVHGGRCEACQGDGVIKVEMHFLADIYVTCDVCRGKRYNRETLEIRYKGLSIHEVLELTVEQAGEFFSAVPALKRRLDTLMEVGLGYVRLGQTATTLSGGEAQRINLSRELSKRETGKTLYILDEPTTGLHFHDIAQLLDVLRRLQKNGNTVIVIEHNLDVIKCADWLIDLGPEGGEGGGRVVAAGPPEAVAQVSASHTGRFLAQTLSPQPMARQAAAGKS